MPETYVRENAVQRPHFRNCVCVYIIALSTGVLFTSASDVDARIKAYGDSTTYIVPARSFLHDGVFLDGTGLPMVGRTPGYPAFLATLLWGTGDNLEAALLIQTAALSSAGVLVYFLAVRLFREKNVALIAAILFAVSPWYAASVGLPMTESLFVTLLIISFLLMHLTCCSSKSRQQMLFAFILGLTVSLAVLVRPVWPLVPLTALAVVWGCDFRRKQAWVMGLVTFVVAAIPIQVWVERNGVERDFPALSSIAGKKTSWLYLASRV